jgi:iron complex outermembrane receptor protein
MTVLRPAIDAAVRAAVGNSNRSAQPAPKYLSRSLWAAALVLGLGSTAQAQKPADETPAASGAGSQLEVEEITVTGSRIKRANDFASANPTTVIDQSYLNNLAITNMGAALTQLPANISTFSPATTGNSSFFAGSIIPNLRGLNPYFGSRTLGMVDSQRFVPTNQGDGLDLNFIPSILVDHMDTVTGGASAAYGSGAIAGVVNFIMNRKLEGGKVDVNYGESELKDAQDKHLGVAYGMSLFGGRGHLVLGGEFEDTGNAHCTTRSWCREGNGFFATGTTSYNLATGLRANQASTTGVFYNKNSPTTYEANSAGNGLLGWNSGVVPAPAAQSAATIGGDGRSPNQFTNLIAPVNRDVIEELFTLALTDKINMKLDGSYGKVETTNYTAAGASTAVHISPDNAYLQLYPALQPAVGPTGATLNKYWDDQVNSLTTTNTTVKRAVIDFNGQFGSSSWTWDGYYEYGHTYRTQLVQDNLHLQEMQLALDSVIGPNGVPVCRSTVTGTVPRGNNPALAVGCTPIDPFGNQPLSPAQRAYGFGNLVENLTYTQNVVAANTTGNLFGGIGAGPWAGAVGAEYRTEKGNNVDNPGVPLAIATDYLTQYGASFAGKVAVTEGFLELSAPLLKDKPFAKELDVDIAVRESKYDNTGLAGTTGEEAKHNMTTWKIQGNWAPTDWFRFRGSQSRDGRAANFRELYYKQIIGAGGLFGYCGPTNSFTQPCQWTLTGNTQLRPEKSDTTTIGFVVEPKEWLPGFQFAADYWRIHITDAILPANPASVLAGCPAPHTAPGCALLTTATPGDYSNITGLTALASNGSGYLYKGIDFTLGYLWDIGGGQRLDTHLLATYMMDQLYQPNPGSAFVNVVGQVGQGNSFLADFQSQAKWAANATSTYTVGPFDVTGQLRFFSGGVMNYNGYPTGATLPGAPAPGVAPPPAFNVSYNQVPSYFLFNLNGSYHLPSMGGLEAQLYGSINNVFNKQPPIAVGVGRFGATNGFGGTNAAFYDTIGRAYKIGVRMTF